MERKNEQSVTDKKNNVSQKQRQLENEKFFERAQKELRRLERSVARKACSPGSNNRQKALNRLRKIHRRI
jgi:hypothetical protein